MRLVHQSEGYPALRRVFASYLAPEASELCCSWPVLTDDLPIESSIVVQVDQTQRSSRVEASRDQLVELRKVVRVDRVAAYISSVVLIDEVLPCHWKPKGVQLDIIDKMVDLCHPIARVDVR